jgi:hypothetical protein
MNMNIAFEIEADTAVEAYQKSQDLEMPHWYQDNTAENVDVFRIDDDEDVDCWPDWSDEVLPIKD